MIHILVSVGWFGITAAILVLSIAALGLDDATLVREAYQFHELLISTIIRPAAIMTVVSGLSLALGTPWGLIKHYWPPAKLIVAIATIALTIPNSPRWIGYAIAHASTPGAALSTVQRDLVAMAVFHLIALELATWLSIYKPGGLTLVGRAQTALRKTTSWARSRACSLSIARLTWVRMVSVLTTNCAAISSFDTPVATQATTSRSRSVRRLTPGCATTAGARRPVLRRRLPRPRPAAAPSRGARWVRGPKRSVSRSSRLCAATAVRRAFERKSAFASSASAACLIDRSGNCCTAKPAAGAQ